MTSEQSRAKGYRNHELVADRLRQPRRQSGYNPAGSIRVTADRDLRDGAIRRGEQGWLQTTDNAGFRGIEASITTEDGRELYHLPLGDFTIDPAVTDTIPVNEAAI